MPSRDEPQLLPWQELELALDRCLVIGDQLKRWRACAAPSADLRFRPEDPRAWSRAFGDLLVECATFYGLVVAAPFVSLSLRYVVVADAGALLVEASFCARRFHEAYTEGDGIRWAVLDGMVTRLHGSLSRMSAHSLPAIVGVSHA